MSNAEKNLVVSTDWNCKKTEKHTEKHIFFDTRQRWKLEREWERGKEKFRNLPNFAIHSGASSPIYCLNPAKYFKGLAFKKVK